MDNQNNNYNMPEEPKVGQPGQHDHQYGQQYGQQPGQYDKHYGQKPGQYDQQYSQSNQQYSQQYSQSNQQYSQQYSQPNQQYSQQYSQPSPRQNYYYTYNPETTAEKKGMPTWAKALLIIAAVLIFAVILASACSKAIKDSISIAPIIDDSYVYTSDYIGVLCLEGTITDGESGDGYNHDWMITRISEMAADPLNKGLVLYIETPGGSSYASRELYLDLLNYKKATNRPLYVYMGSQATSGGYYAAMAADRIYANEECWTGSIGVIISGLYDLSGLFEKYGIKAENIVSGKNKDIGTNIKPMTDEQRAILQSLVDDTFDRFVQAVVDGRKMPESKVRQLADGRIYSATQAIENGLIDAIGTIDDAVYEMQDKYELEDATPEIMQYTPPADLRSYLGFDAFGKNASGDSAVGALSGNLPEGDLSALLRFLEKGDTYELMCIAPVQK